MGFRKKRDFTIYVAKTKALISFAVTVKLICVFVFAYAKCLFSHDVAQISVTESSPIIMPHLENNNKVMCWLSCILVVYIYGIIRFSHDVT